ncbi:DUF6286 domain-containing protein [Actinoallomurus soli]|uniref:DUF6286 domain-containing protein n=1 Tax=Actinoallomurus soli TaxID=2952535 RepID=UPI002092EE6C|nr:DUF6286 domain-containing protein [Actinoallomurus soli]MCO5974014.1 DUF6286 domain-containing protein [Actinoallomurus soli]
MTAPEQDRPAEATAPLQGRPPAEMSRRERRRAFRPRRAIPAIVTAAALAAATILIAVEVITALVSHRAGNVLPVPYLARLGRDTRWADPLALAVAALIAALGLLLLLLALWPGRPRVIALAFDDPAALVGITVAGLRRQLAQAARTVDGVTGARVRVRRGGVRVRAVSPLRDPQGLAEQVEHAVTGRIRELAPLHPPRVHVTVRHRED